MTSVQTSWQRIEAWLHANAPALLEQLPPGVSDEELAQAEALMGGLTLPADFKASYRRHNGWGASRLFLGRLRLYPLAGVTSTWQMMHDLLEAGDFDRGLNWKHAPLHFGLADPIRPVWWHLAWVPFAGDESGEEWAVDLAPAPGGQMGQVIDWEHESGPGRVRCASLEALFATFAEGLEAGHYLSFGVALERRLEGGKAAREQAMRHALAQPSPATPLLDHAFRLGWAVETRQDRIQTLNAILQMETASAAHRFQAYIWLIDDALSQKDAEEAKHLLDHLAAEAHSLPQEHWVWDEVERCATNLARLRLHSIFDVYLLQTAFQQEEASPQERRFAALRLAWLYQNLQQPEEARQWTEEAARFQPAGAEEEPAPSTFEFAAPLVLSPARQVLKQAYEAGRAIALRDRVALNEAVAQQMVPLLLTVLDLEEAQMEDRLLAGEWLLLIHLDLKHLEQVKALLPRCQREAEQAPAHYEIHRTLQRVTATLAGA